MKFIILKLIVLLKNAKNDIKSYEHEIDRLYKMIKAKQEEIDKLKMQYK